MRSVFLKVAAFVVALVMMAGMFSACAKEETDMQAVVDAAVKSALEQAVFTPGVTISADGKEITIENTAGQTIRQLLEQAEVSLNQGDMIAIDPEQRLDNLTIQVLRKCSVIVVLAAANPLDDIHHSATLYGGTVADAIASVGVVLTPENEVNHDLNAPVKDGMEILITVKPEEPVEETTEPVEEEDEEETDSNNNNNNSNTGSGNNSNTGSGNNSNTGSGNNSNTGSGNNSTPAPTTPTPAPTETTPTEPATTAPTDPPRTVVSVEVYEDCDGSGHGVKVITYSDGTQEEVYF